MIFSSFLVLFFLSGEFQAYWKAIYEVVREQRHTFGTLANKSTFDEKWFEKRSRAANDPSNPFNPFSNYEHYMYAALENLMVTFALRSQEASSLVVEDFEEDYIFEGDFKGIPFICLKETFHGQKGKAITMKNPTLDAENSKKKTFPCPYNQDPLSCYQTTKRLIRMIPDDCQASEGGRRLFRHPASKDQLQQWIAQKKPWRYSPLKHRVVGLNSINGYLKKVAGWCKYTNPERQTSHGKRRAGISKVANAGVAPAALVQIGGHNALKMVATYNKPNQEAYDSVIRATHGSPTQIRKQLANSDEFGDLDLTSEEMDTVLASATKPAYKIQDRKPTAVDLKHRNLPSSVNNRRTSSSGNRNNYREPFSDSTNRSRPQDRSFSPEYERHRNHRDDRQRSYHERSSEDRYPSSRLDSNARKRRKEELLEELRRLRSPTPEKERYSSSRRYSIDHPPTPRPPDYYEEDRHHRRYSYPEEDHHRRSSYPEENRHRHQPEYGSEYDRRLSLVANNRYHNE